MVLLYKYLHTPISEMGYVTGLTAMLKRDSGSSTRSTGEPVRILEPEFPKLETWTVDGVEAISEIMVGHGVESSNVPGAVVVVLVVHSATDSMLLSSSFSEVLPMAESLLKFSLFFPPHVTVTAAPARFCLVRKED